MVDTTLVLKKNSGRDKVIEKQISDFIETSLSHDINEASYDVDVMITALESSVIKSFTLIGALVELLVENGTLEKSERLNAVLNYIGSNVNSVDFKRLGD